MLNTKACSRLGFFSMETAVTKFILLLFVLIDEEIIGWSLVDILSAILSAVRLLSLDGVDEAGGGGGFLVAMREI